ncbi:hypothetical protein GUJ93_ZPchr0012g21669 [Zizania palustris]|uniref:Uncharacterized protein n=1 Tax=Zizania palustris TaxID=103762 RepID=A0A8J6BRV3_ZIZPA|nr:hypothetical protein GUJ93_ZPchr0012g21669 [Zizania palustris]
MDMEDGVTRERLAMASGVLQLQDPLGEIKKANNAKVKIKVQRYCCQETPKSVGDWILRLIAMEGDHQIVSGHKMHRRRYHAVEEQERQKQQRRLHVADGGGGGRGSSLSSYFSAEAVLVLACVTVSLLVLPLILPPLPPPPSLLLLVPVCLLLLLVVLAFMPTDMRSMASSYL